MKKIWFAAAFGLALLGVAAPASAADLAAKPYVKATEATVFVERLNIGFPPVTLVTVVDGSIPMSPLEWLASRRYHDVRPA